MKNIVRINVAIGLMQLENIDELLMIQGFHEVWNRFHGSQGGSMLAEVFWGQSNKRSGHFWRQNWKPKNWFQGIKEPCASWVFMLLVLSHSSPTTYSLTFLTRIPIKPSRLVIQLQRLLWPWALWYSLRLYPFCNWEPCRGLQLHFCWLSAAGYLANSV